MKYYLGYWAQTENEKSEFPFPVANKEENNNEALMMLDKIISHANENNYRGFSTCRCCNKINGNAEYEIKIENDTYVIPEGYAHYLSEHKITPTLLLSKLYNELQQKVKDSKSENNLSIKRPKI